MGHFSKYKHFTVFFLLNLELRLSLLGLGQIALSTETSKRFIVELNYFSPFYLKMDSRFSAVSGKILVHAISMPSLTAFPSMFPFISFFAFKLY